MRCSLHRDGLSHKPFTVIPPCCECGNSTWYQCDVICIDCSDKFDQCTLCREQLKTNRDKRLIASFRSPEAVSIRTTRLQARADHAARSHAVRADLAADCAPHARVLQEQLRPYRLACQKACQPFRDKLDAVNEEIAASQPETALAAIQMASISARQQKAIELCDSQCEPHLAKYEKNVSALVAAYRKKVTPHVATSKRRLALLQNNLDDRLRELDNEMSSLLHRSTSPWHIACKTCVRFFQNIFRRR